MALQEALKRLRDELGVTQTQLAGKLGISFATVSRWENGKVVPNVRVATEVMATVEEMPVSSSCISYLKKALFPEKTDQKIAAIRRLDMNMAGQLVDDSSVGVFVCNANTYKLLYMNKVVEHWCGEVENLPNLTCYSYLAKRDTPCPWCSKQYMTKDSYHEREVHLDNGRHYLAKGKFIDWEGKLAIVEYISNESDTLSRQIATRQMVDQIPCGIGTYYLCSDGQSECIYQNNALLNRLHIICDMREHPQQQTALELVASEDRGILIAEVQAAVKEHRNICIDIRLRCDNQNTKWLHITGSVAQQSDEKMALYLLFSDIDESQKTKSTY